MLTLERYLNRSLGAIVSSSDLDVSKKNTYSTRGFLHAESKILQS